ncbi:MAG TPA: PilZ domain-containing protein [Candidatus Acidoferrum sp.]|nr:PilZ domain-containing protein [Candidatus Acidoferrum sp.]
MEKNRRRFLRKVPDDIAFIQIERDEIGKVLNISEGGLSFSSITPVPRNLPVYFWFSFNLKDRIEAMGEVTWTDISRTIGGLRFTQLSQANRDLIEKWVARLRQEEPPEEIESLEEEVPEPEEEALVPQFVAVGDPEPFRTYKPAAPALPVKPNGLDRVARFVSKARAYKPLSSFGRKIAEESKPAPTPALGATAPALGTSALAKTALGIEPPKLLPERPMFSMEAGPAPSMPSMAAADARSSSFDTKSSPLSSSFSFRGIESLIELVPLQRHLSAKKRQLVCGVLLGIGISALVTLPALKFWNSRAHAETIKPAVTDSSTLRSNASTQPPASDPATVTSPKPTYPVAGVFSDPNPVLPGKGTASTLASRSQLPASYWKQLRAEPPKTTPVKAQKPSAVTAASSSASTTKDKKSGMNPTQLWTEVQAGNSKAAVELAELYIKGNGVPKNCQQARVLLLAASEKRNTAAIKRLQDLDNGSACP